MNISRAAFTSGKSPFEYIPVYNISLFLSTNTEDVNNAIFMKYPAGIILNTNVLDDEDDNYKKVLRTAIITARNAHSHKRAINTLKSWEVEVDEMIS